jgi:hypothetical protein
VAVIGIANLPRRKGYNVIDNIFVNGALSGYSSHGGRHNRISRWPRWRPAAGSAGHYDLLLAAQKEVRKLPGNFFSTPLLSANRTAVTLDARIGNNGKSLLKSCSNAHSLEWLEKHVVQILIYLPFCLEPCAVIFEAHEDASFVQVLQQAMPRLFSLQNTWVLLFSPFMNPEHHCSTVQYILT